MQFVPDTYTIGEALKVFRKLMPLGMQVTLLALDNSFDKVSDVPEASLASLTKIVDSQDAIIKTGKRLTAEVAETRKRLEREADGDQ